jgi:PAS domain S-box-containing protein
MGNFFSDIVRDQTLSLQIRLFRLVCLAGAIVSLAIAVPFNIFQNIPPIVSYGAIVMGSVSLLFYRESRRGRNYLLSYVVVIVGLLDAIWFPNAGPDGSVTVYFLPAVLYAMVVCRGRAGWLLTLFLTLNVCGLLTLDYCFPALKTPYLNRLDRLVDLVTSVICAFTFTALIVWSMVANYDWDQKTISTYAADLATSERHYREVVENAKCVILRIDATGRVTFFNRFAEELFGYKREDILGKHLVGAIVPAASLKGENLADAVEELLKKPAGRAQGESESVCHDGRRIRVNWAYQPVYDGAGKLQEILCAGADVTERAMLLERLQLTQTTMDAAAEQIIWIDRAARLIYANAAALDSLGYTAGESKHLTIHDITTDCPPAVWERRLVEIKRDRRATFEAIQLAKDGSARPVEFSVSYLGIEGDEYAMAFIRDLTGRKQAEEKRLQQEQQTRRLQMLESLGVLAGGIAHDFNNLLTAIMTGVSMVKMDSAPGSEAHEMLGEAEKASARAMELTAQLLTFAKGGKPVKAALSVERVIEGSSSFALRGSATSCVMNFAEGLWPVEADAGQLGQVFNNLLMNARQAMLAGGRVVVGARNRVVGAADGLMLKDGNYVQITVQDHGEGISEENLARIFDPYFTTKASGSGLGLAVAHSVIKNHHGTISVQSKVGAGSTFTVLLPATEPLTAPGPVAHSARVAGPVRVLLMDDEELVRKTVVRLLQRFGYQVETARDGTEAIEAYRRFALEGRPFDVVIMDLTVPGAMGGEEAVRHLREMDPRVKAIVASGYSDNPVMADHEKYGFKGVMTKPFTIDQLKSVVQTVLAST